MIKKPLRILMLEDSVEDVELNTAELERAKIPHTSVSVNSKESFLTHLDKGPWDLILSDYLMPNFTALDALNILHEKKIDIPFIIISGSIGETTAVEAMKAGAHDYLMKDDLARLKTAIEREVHDHVLRQERRQLEKQLQENKATLERAQQIAHIGSWVSELLLQGKQTWSKETCRIFGLTEDEFDQKIETFFSMIHPDDLAAFQTARQEALQDGAPYNMDVRIIRRDGALRWVHTQAEIIRDGNGNPLRMIGTLQDITERKELEENLRQAQKMEAVGRLAGGIAHDFNNLLTAITGYANLVLRNLKEDDPNKTDLKEIQKAAEQAALLTRQLLTFSRKQVLQPRILDLNEIIHDMDKMLRRVIGEHIELVTRLESDIPLVKVDPGQMEQVVLNLIINARDAMPKGGRVTIRTSSIEHVSGIQPGDSFPNGTYVFLTVQDNGIGMNAETLAHIFEPFFTTKEIGKGTGLGLATAYSVIQLAGGFIHVESKLTQGTLFKIFLPAVLANPRDRKKQPIIPPAEKRGTETVLLVEDDNRVRTVLAKSLKQKGYHVHEVMNGEEALKWAMTNPCPIDVLVTDVQMPLMNGRELVERLSSLRTDLRVLFISGYAQETLAPEGILETDIALLQKPFTPEALTAKIRELLDSPLPQKTETPSNETSNKQPQYLVPHNGA
jgi:two-component system cell cycle sensor histidine kinase/response regulator CckA